MAQGRADKPAGVRDVGFGKTEMALRAAAATVLSGKQVALLAPTRILARQHLAFRRRFARFDVRIEAAARSTRAAAFREIARAAAPPCLLIIAVHRLSGCGDQRVASLGAADAMTVLTTT